MSDDVVINKDTTDIEFAERFSKMLVNLQKQDTSKACEYASYIMFNYCYDKSLLDIVDLMLEKLDYKNLDIMVIYCVLDVCFNRKVDLKNYEKVKAGSKLFYTTKYDISKVEHIYMKL